MRITKVTNSDLAQSCYITIKDLPEDWITLVLDTEFCIQKMDEHKIIIKRRTSSVW